MPPDCVDLTLDSDEERDVRSYERKRPTPDAGSDCVLVDDPDQEQKRRKSESQQHGAAAQQQPDQGMDEDNDDVVVEGVTGVVALKDLAHTRPQCGNFVFKQSVCEENGRKCAQCYCFVCDVKAEDCQYWGTGARARDHCNAHTSHYWNSLKRMKRKHSSSSAALLQQEFNNTSKVLSTNWTLTDSSNRLNSATSRRTTTPGRGGTLNSLWARKAAENQTGTPKTPAAVPAAAAGATPSSISRPAAAAAAAAKPVPAPAAAVVAPPSSSSRPAAPGQAVSGPTACVKAEPVQQKMPAPRPHPNPPPASTWLTRQPHPSQSRTPMQLCCAALCISCYMVGDGAGSSQQAEQTAAEAAGDGAGSSQQAEQAAEAAGDDDDGAGSGEEAEEQGEVEATSDGEAAAPDLSDHEANEGAAGGRQAAAEGSIRAPSDHAAAALDVDDEAQRLAAAEAGMQCSQELTPYLHSQIEYLQRALQRYEALQQQEQQQEPTPI